MLKDKKMKITKQKCKIAKKMKIKKKMKNYEKN